MRRNSSGKVVTIFVVIMAILLISLTAISVFIFQKEKEKRMEAEKDLKSKRNQVIEVKTEIREVKRKNFLLQEKNKDADDRINNLMDELELEKGLREEIKQESLKLKNQVEEADEAQKKLQKKWKEQLSDSSKKVSDLQAKLKEKNVQYKELEVLRKKNKILKVENADLKDKNAELKDEVQKVLEEKVQIETEKLKQNIVVKERENISSVEVKKEVKLEPIIVVSKEKVSIKKKKEVVFSGMSPEGKILSVDRETNFVVVNVGKEDGIKKGQKMSVYREQEYLGDIKVTRVQPQMSAADIIPPLDSRVIQKNDRVIVK